MSKMSELSLAVDELKRCGEALIGISETLCGLISVNDNAQSRVQSAPEPPTRESNPITLEMVRAVLAEKSRAGYTAEVRALLEKHGAAKLSEINPDEYSTLLAEAEVLGNG